MSKQQHKRIPEKREAPVVTNPLPDWVPLWKAPFFCLSDGRMHTAKTWPDAFCEEVRKLTSSLHVGRQLHPRLLKVGWPKWTTTILKNGRDVRIEALDVCTLVAPGYIFLSGLAGEWFKAGDGFLNAPKWDRDIPACDKDGAFAHGIMLKDLSRKLSQNFAHAVSSGAAHLMARPTSVLAPFERIAWDQWQFFELEREDQSQTVEFFSAKAVYDPRIPFFSSEGRMPATAVGPNGERIYSIHAAPGDMVDESPQEKCVRRVRQLMLDYSDRCPWPAADLVKNLVAEFPGVTKKDVRYCVSRAQAETKNATWLRAGRPTKIPAEIPLK